MKNYIFKKSFNNDIIFSKFILNTKSGMFFDNFVETFININIIPFKINLKSKIIKFQCFLYSCNLK